MTISTAELEHFNAKNQVEFNKNYAEGYNEDGTKRFQEMCLIMSADSERYSFICNNLKNRNLMDTDN